MREDLNVFVVRDNKEYEEVHDGYGYGSRNEKGNQHQTLEGHTSCVAIMLFKKN